MTPDRFIKGVTPATTQWYKSSFKAFDGALDSKASILDRIIELKKTNAPVSINTYLRCLNAYFRWLHEEHGQQALRIARLKEEQKVIETLSPEHITKLLRWQPGTDNERRLSTLILLLLDTGLRIQEALELKKQNLDFDNLHIRVLGKGQKQRLVPMSQELRKVLYRYCQRRKAELLFATSSGLSYGQRNVLRDFKVLAKRLGITGVRFSAHTMRHTFSVIYLRNGGNLFYLSKILGHQDIQTTQRYLQSLYQVAFKRLGIPARPAQHIDVSGPYYSFVNATWY